MFPDSIREDDEDSDVETGKLNFISLIFEILNIFMLVKFVLFPWWKNTTNN